MGLVLRKPVFGTCDRAKPNSACSATKTRWNNEISHIASLANMSTIERVYNKCADQTAPVRRLICVFVVRKKTKLGFLMTRPLSHTIEK